MNVPTVSQPSFAHQWNAATSGLNRSSCSGSGRDPPRPSRTALPGTPLPPGFTGAGAELNERMQPLGWNGWFGSGSHEYLGVARARKGAQKSSHPRFQGSVGCSEVSRHTCRGPRATLTSVSQLRGPPLPVALPPVLWQPYLQRQEGKTRSGPSRTWQGRTGYVPNLASVPGGSSGNGASGMGSTFQMKMFYWSSDLSCLKAFRIINIFHLKPSPRAIFLCCVILLIYPWDYNTNYEPTSDKNMLKTFW